MQKLFQNKVTIILLIIALVVLLAACNQNMLQNGKNKKLF